jgi:hypothetical protein
VRALVGMWVGRCEETKRWSQQRMLVSSIGSPFSRLFRSGAGEGAYELELRGG